MGYHSDCYYGSTGLSNHVSDSSRASRGRSRSRFPVGQGESDCACDGGRGPLTYGMRAPIQASFKPMTTRPNTVARYLFRFALGWFHFSNSGTGTSRDATSSRSILGGCAESDPANSLDISGPLWSLTLLLEEKSPGPGIPVDVDMAPEQGGRPSSSFGAFTCETVCLSRAGTFVYEEDKSTVYGCFEVRGA